MGSLELQVEGAPSGAALSARVRFSRFTARAWTLFGLFVLAVTLGSLAGRPINLAASFALGFLCALLLEKYWLEKLSVLAVLDEDRFTVVHRFGARVQSTQAIPLDHQSRFTLSEPSRFLSMNASDRHCLRFGEHVIKLPFVLASPERAARICDAWNQLVELQSADSA